MPQVAGEVGVRMSLGIRRDPMTSRLRVYLTLQQHVGEKTTTLQEASYEIGEDQLFSRLQEHSNNCLLRLAQTFQRLEKTLP